jgi:hypothetical protein
MSVFLDLLNSLAGGSPTRVKGVRRHPRGAANVHRNGVRRVRPDTTPLMQRRGWKRRGNTWTGHYVSSYGTFGGKLERRGDVFEVLIKNPPDVVANHKRFICFHRRSGGWWSVHLHDQPTDGDPNAVVAYIERLLAEAYALARK